MTQSTSPVLFSPFLLATDGSPSARLAQKLLSVIAQTVQAERNGSGLSLITVLTVQPRRSSRSKVPLRKEPAPSPLAETAQPSTTAIHDAPEVAAAANPADHAGDLAATVQADFPANMPISSQVRQGRPAIEILNCARLIRAGLIAVGSRGTSGMRGRLIGSVSAVIARYAPCSVLVARGAAVPSDVEPSLHHILLVVSDAPATQDAIATAQQLVPAGVQRITILYAQPPLNADYLFGPFATPTPSWQLSQSLQDAQREQSEQILQQSKAALTALNVDVYTVRQTGEPGPLICQVAQQQQVDLIVLGGNVMRRWLNLSPGDALLPLQSLRRPKPSDPESVKPLPVLRNTRLSAAEDFTIHHAPCPVLLCRSTPAVSK